MDTLFVHENPDQDAKRNKRPRVVTACDECRDRRIKCVAAAPDASDKRCDACVDANVQCTYNAKAAYWESRRPTSAAGRPRTSSRTRPDSPSFNAAGSVEQASSSSRSRRAQQAPSGLAIVAYPDSGRSGSSRQRRSHHTQFHPYKRSPLTSASSSGGSYDLSPYASGSHAMYGGHGSAGIHYGMPGIPNVSPPRELQPLFDDNAQYPHPALMPAYLYAFFQNFGVAYSFITYEESVYKHTTSTLKPVLANVIAAMAAPLTHIPELSGQDLQQVSKRYMTTAKSLLPSLLRGAVSSSTLHAIVLIAWAELSQNPHNAHEFKYYSELALAKAIQFGIDNEGTIQSVLAPGNAIQQGRLRATWSCISQLFPAGPPRSYRS